MKILFVSSGRLGEVNPIIKNQGESLRKAGVDLDYFVVKGRGWKSYVRNIKPLRKQIKTGNYDVIHAHYAFCAYLVNFAAVGLHKPLVVSLMGSDIWVHKFYPPIIRMFNHCAHWKAVIVKSLEMQQRVGMPQSLIIPNGVNMERFCEMEKLTCQKMLGWDSSKLHVHFPADPALGRKNWPLAEGAVALLNGEGFSGLVVSGEIELHGMKGVPNEQTPIMYNAADAVVLPSFYEGSANAVKEAMACNRPLVTTDMGDCRERMEGCKGCYVANTYEVPEFAELLAKALKDEKSEGRERLLKDGIADYQIAERLIKIYNNVI